jgi:hypothetical protein
MSELFDFQTDELLVFKEISGLIENSRSRSFAFVNSELTVLFWQIGKIVNDHILKNKRASYGKKVIVSLSGQLESNFGRNFESKNLRRMIQFSEIFPNLENVVTVSRHLSWSHFLALIPLKNHD